MMRESRSTLEWTLITLILLVAALFRFHLLGDVPKGLEHDEVATWHMGAAVLEGERPLYFEEGYGHEPLFNYMAALSMSWFGHNWLGERFWAPWLGIWAVAATYALMRRMFGPLVGLSAAGLQATVLWAFFFNRLGLRLNLVPFLFCVIAYCFWRGIERASGASLPGGSALRPGEGAAQAGAGVDAGACRLGWLIAAGVGIGISFYSYPSARMIPLVFAVFSAYLVVRDLWTGKRRPAPGTGLDGRLLLARWWPLAVCFAVAGLVMLPLALHLARRTPMTDIPQRVSQVNMPVEELKKGNLGPILENAWGLLKMWNVDGERYWQLNYSHRPVFVEPVGGALFWIGALILFWRWQEPQAMLLLVWVAFSMVPSLLTSEAPSWPRTMLASPAALALPGLAAARLVEYASARPRIGRWARPLLGALLALSVLLTAALTYRDYMVEWPQHPRVRYAFQSSLTEALRYLDAVPDATPVVMAGLSPHDMDPWTTQCTLRRRDLAVRWVDSRSALVLPAAQTSRFVALDITPVEPLLFAWAGLGGQAPIAQGKIVLRGGTENDPDAPLYADPAYSVYRLESAALRAGTQRAEHATGVGGDPFDPIPLDASPRFGELVELVGYEWLDAPQAGDQGHLLTFWRALAPGPSAEIYGQPALRIFVHLLDREHDVVAGTDVLGAAPDTWVKGDVIVQLHTLTCPDAPGKYAVELGWYVPPDGPRLPVSVPGEDVAAPGERVLLVPLEIYP
jgi:4-amino-4-deoxy-L-arabinose transferase-like glycosyltransferase